MRHLPMDGVWGMEWGIGFGWFCLTNEGRGWPTCYTSIGRPALPHASSRQPCLCSTQSPIRNSRSSSSPVIATFSKHAGTLCSLSRSLCGNMGLFIKGVYRMYAFRGSSLVRRAVRRKSIGIRMPSEELGSDALRIVRDTTIYRLDEDQWKLVRRCYCPRGAWDLAYNRDGRGSGYDDAIGLDLLRLKAGGVSEGSENGFRSVER